MSEFFGCDHMLEWIMHSMSADRIFTNARQVIQRGGIIAFPTESFYALGVHALDNEAVRRLFELKKRTADKPLPVIVGNIDVLMSIVKRIPEPAEELIEKYWPGPLTIIFEARERVPFLLTGGTGKVAARIPGEGMALDIARALLIPLTATSANPSASPPAVTPEEVAGFFGDKVGLIIDGGKAPGGSPSTIIDVTSTPPIILRKGRILLKADEK